MGGRKKVYTNLDALASKDSVRRWLEGLTEGHSRRHAIYSVNRYILWRKSRGLESNPDRWVEECTEGSVKTLTDHLRVLQDYVKSSHSLPLGQYLLSVEGGRAQEGQDHVGQ